MSAAALSSPRDGGDAGPPPRGDADAAGGVEVEHPAGARLAEQFLVAAKLVASRAAPAEPAEAPEKEEEDDAEGDDDDEEEEEEEEAAGEEASPGGSRSDLRVSRQGYLMEPHEYDRELERWARYRRPERDAGREKKWIAMLREFRPQSKVVKRRVRKGVPDAFRFEMWLRLTGANEALKAEPEAYADLVPRDADDETVLQIKKDRGRTMQNHVMFRGLNPGHHDLDLDQGAGQDALFHVLKALALRMPENGYCQSMASPAAMLLTYMPDEQAFWTMERLMTGARYGNGLFGGDLPFGALYRRGFPLLMEFMWIFDRLLERRLPRLARNFDEIGYLSTIYGTRWFQTVFDAFPPALVLRIWDVLLAEGPKVLFRFALLVMQRLEPRLAAADFVTVAMTVQNVGDEEWLHDTDGVMAAVFEVPLTTADLARLRKKYVKSTQDSGKKKKKKGKKKKKSK